MLCLATRISVSRDWAWPSAGCSRSAVPGPSSGGRGRLPGCRHRPAWRPRPPAPPATTLAEKGCVDAADRSGEGGHLSNSRGLPAILGRRPILARRHPSPVGRADLTDRQMLAAVAPWITSGPLAPARVAPPGRDTATPSTAKCRRDRPGVSPRLRPVPVCDHHRRPHHDRGRVAAGKRDAAGHDRHHQLQDAARRGVRPGALPRPRARGRPARGGGAFWRT